jgi:hypothetical protein
MTVTTLAPTEAPPLPQETLARRPWFRRALDHPNWLSLLAYGILSLVSTWPTWPGDPARTPTCACEDIEQAAWFLKYTPWAILHGQNLFGTHLMQVPQGVDLAQNTTMWLLGVLTAPLTLALNPFASLNLIHYLAFALSAFAMYVFLRRFIRFAPAAFIGGLLYGFSPYMVAQGSLHFNLIFVPIPPLIFLCLYELLIVQSGRAWRWGLLLGALAIAQFFIAAEILLSTALFSGIGLIVLALTCIRDLPSRWRHGLTGLGTAALVTAAALAYPMWMMRHGPNHYNGPAQGFNNPFNSDLLGAVVPTSYQRFAPDKLARIGDLFVSANIHEDDAYIGIPMILIAIYLVCRYWRRLWMLYLAVMAVTAWVISLGWELVVDRRVKHLPFEMPFLKLERLPFVANLEAVRLSLYYDLFIAVILAIGIDAYAQDWRARRRDRPETQRSVRVIAGRTVGAGVAVVALLSLLPNWPYKSFPLAKYATIPTAQLAVIPKNAITLTYPFASAYTTEAMIWQEQADFQFRLLGGYALIAGPDRGSEYPRLLYPVAIEALFQQSILGKGVPLLPEDVASRATDNTHWALALRRFVRINHVQAVVIEMGRYRSKEVAALAHLALGRPTESTASAEIWTDISAVLHRPPSWGGAV